MSAGVAVLPLARRSRRFAPTAPRSWLTFSEPGAPLVAVCGLHGGAGTTTLACLLAEHAAALSPAGRVLVAEGDARAAELADRLGVASQLSLAQLAASRAVEPTPQHAPVAERADGLRVLAAAAPDPAEAPATALAAVLAEARAVHALCVVDAGSVRQHAAESALAGADVVVWVADPNRLDAAAFASPLMRPARGARWVLALVPRNGGSRGRRTVPRAIRDDLSAVVAVRSGSFEGEAGRDAAERLAQAVRE